MKKLLVLLALSASCSIDFVNVAAAAAAAGTPASTMATTVDTMQAFWRALKHDDADTVVALHEKIPYTMSAFELAVLHGKPKTVRALLSTGKYDVNIRREGDKTPLHDAAMTRLPSCDSNGVSTANYACSSWDYMRYGHHPEADMDLTPWVEVIDILVDAGADVHAKTSDGFTPIDLAACYANKDLVERLMHHGASITATTKRMVGSMDWPYGLFYGSICARRAAAGELQPESHQRSIVLFGYRANEVIKLVNAEPATLVSDGAETTSVFQSCVRNVRATLNSVRTLICKRRRR